MSQSTRSNTRLAKQYGDIGKYFITKEISKKHRKNDCLTVHGKKSMNNNDDEEVDYKPTIINSMLQSDQQRKMLLLLPEELNSVDDKYPAKRSLKLFDNVVEHHEDTELYCANIANYYWRVNYLGYPRLFDQHSRPAFQPLLLDEHAVPMIEKLRSLLYNSTGNLSCLSIDNFIEKNIIPYHCI
jgi:hypothetical protein